MLCYVILFYMMLYINFMLALFQYFSFSRKISASPNFLFSYNKYFNQNYPKNMHLQYNQLITYSIQQQINKYKQTNKKQVLKMITIPHQTMYMARSTLFLGDDLSARKKKEQPLIPVQLQTLVGKVQSFVDDINNKITNRIQLVQQVYLDDYKQQVFQMSNQLRNIRAMLDSQIIKQRANEKMFYLQEERDFFRSQVVKLNIEVNKLNQQNCSLKKKYEQEKNQSDNYRKIVYNLETKLLKIRNLDIQSHNFDRSNLVKNFANKNSTIQTASKTVLTTTRYNKSSINNQEDQNQNEDKMIKTTNRLRPSQSMKNYNNKFATASSGPGMTSYQKGFFIKTKTKLQRPDGYDQILQKQQIIDQCMNQVKKQIYYRNISIKDKESRLHFNVSQQVPFQKFTKTDKKELIIKLLSHQRVLQQFYEYLFSKRKNQDESIKLKTIKSKITDARFNTKMLSELKTQFNKKIFDIKFNQ